MDGDSLSRKTSSRVCMSGSPTVCGERFGGRAGEQGWGEQRYWQGRWVPPSLGAMRGTRRPPGLGARLRGARGLLRPRTFTTFVIPGLGKPASSLTATVSTECESLKRWNTLPWSAGPRLGISAAHDIAGGFLRLLGRHSHYKHFAFPPYLLLREIFAFNSRTL